jgi:hypothetical protein
VRVDRDWVEYDTAESTTRVGHGPQASTWRLPARGRMNTAHLQFATATAAGAGRALGVLRATGAVLRCRPRKEQRQPRTAPRPPAPRRATRRSRGRWRVTPSSVPSCRGVSRRGAAGKCDRCAAGAAVQRADRARPPTSGQLRHARRVALAGVRERGALRRNEGGRFTPC